MNAVKVKNTKLIDQLTELRLSVEKLCDCNCDVVDGDYGVPRGVTCEKHEVTQEIERLIRENGGPRYGY